jgi:hypothetical protein
VRKLTFFLAAVFSVLFAEKALCHATAFSIESKSLNSFRYEEMRVEEAAPLSIRTGRFLSVDPNVDIEKNRPEPQRWNRYAYATNNPESRFDPDGRDSRAMSEFIKQHPWAASQIGWVIPHTHTTNITTNSVRFSSDLVAESASHTGSPRNAVRHVIWQAAITARFDSKIATQIGNAHEDNPAADLNTRQFSGPGSAAKADEVVDLLNNQIGRAIGAAHPGASMNELAGATLDYYHTTGLFTESVGRDGSIVVSQTKLSDQAYTEAKAKLANMDENGFSSK